MFDKWKRKLKEKLNRMNEDDRGSAFLIVILGVMFMTIVGSTVMSLATNYVITVIVDQNSTDNFYETEGVLAEVRSGLEEVCGECNEKSYMEIINKYNADSMSGKMKKEYGMMYLSGIASALTNSTVSWPADSEWTVYCTSCNKDVQLTSEGECRDCGKKNLLWKTSQKSFNLDPVIQKMITRPYYDNDTTKPTLTSTYGGGILRYWFTWDKKEDEMTLIISGLKVRYKDEDGYESTIQTDVSIEVPDYGFEGNTTFDEMKKYLIICDNKLEVSTNAVSSGGSGVEFVGNIYTGGETGKYGDSGNYATGIDIKSQAKTVRFNSDTIISRGDFSIQNGAEVEVNNQSGELWVKNVILESAADAGSTLQTRLDLFTNSYVLNDMSINNNNANVHIGGKYYGYSFNQSNDASRTDDNESEYSSAILVNGSNTTLTSNNLDKLILAGRTFVSKNDKNFTPLASSDIMMGESLAVKSNQIAYLVPTSCILPLGQGHNPLLSSEIDADNIMASISLDTLKQTDAWPYLNEAKPVIANFNNSGGYVFLYLNFKSPGSANQYFSKFYSDADNKASLDNRAETYISTTDPDGMKLSAGLYLIAGNIIHNYYGANGSVKQTANYYEGSGAPNGEVLSDGAKKMRNYLGKQLALVNSGYHSGMPYRYELLADSDKSELVQDKIVYFNKIDNPDPEDDPLPLTRENTDTDVGGKIYITAGDCNVSSTINRGIIVSGGNVQVDANFEGLILARGKVSAHGSSITATSNLAMIGSLFEMIRNDSSLSQYFRGLEEEDESSSNVAECIHYENWKRNE